MTLQACKECVTNGNLLHEHPTEPSARKFVQLNNLSVRSAQDLRENPFGTAPLIFMVIVISRSYSRSTGEDAASLIKISTTWR
jgi:hypothetical protein